MILPLEPHVGHHITLLWVKECAIKEHPNIALIDPHLILSPLHVHVAACRAMASASNLKTKSLTNELIYCLSPSTNITESLKTFKAKGGECLAVAFDMSEQEMLNSIGVQRDPISPDLDLIRKIYRVPTACDNIESFVINSISIKGV